MMETSWPRPPELKIKFQVRFKYLYVYVRKIDHAPHIINLQVEAIGKIEYIWIELDYKFILCFVR